MELNQIQTINNHKSKKWVRLSSAYIHVDSSYQVWISLCDTTLRDNEICHSSEIRGLSFMKIVMGRVDKCRVRVGFGFWNFFRARVGSGFEIFFRVFYYTIFPKIRVFSGFRVGFALFRVRVGFGLEKNPRVGSGFRVPDPSLTQIDNKWRESFKKSVAKNRMKAVYRIDKSHFCYLDCLLNELWMWCQTD